MEIKKKKALVFVIVGLLWFGVICGITLLTTLYGIKLQNSFLHVLLYTGELMIGVLFWGSCC